MYKEHVYLDSRYVGEYLFTLKYIDGFEKPVHFKVKYIPMKHQEMRYGGMPYHREQLSLKLNFANSIYRGYEQSCDRLHTSINSSVCCSISMYIVCLLAGVQVWDSGMAYND